MFPLPLLLSIWVVAARPFLPAGRGGLILIAGGLSMTALAMLVLMSRHHPIPAGQRPRAAPPSGVRPRQSATLAPRPPSAVGGTPPAEERSGQIARLVHPGDQQLVWPAYVRQAAGKAGLHNTEVLSVEKTRCVIEVRHCRSCLRGRSCEPERRRLLRAARKLSRRARVRELACNVEGRKVCRFHVDMGGHR